MEVLLQRVENSQLRKQILDLHRKLSRTPMICDNCCLTYQKGFVCKNCFKYLCRDCCRACICDTLFCLECVRVCTNCRIPIAPCCTSSQTFVCTYCTSYNK